MGPVAGTIQFLPTKDRQGAGGLPCPTGLLEGRGRAAGGEKERSSVGTQKAQALCIRHDRGIFLGENQVGEAISPLGLLG